MCADAVKTVRVRVEGLVQGVGFRAFVVQRAGHLGVTGWVRNTPEGAVEVEAQGDARAVEQLLLEVRRGPRMAKVSDMTAESVREGPAYPTFEIRW